MVGRLKVPPLSFICLLLLFCSNSYAVQNSQKEPQQRLPTRAERWRQKREVKSKQLSSPKKQFWENYLYRFDQKGNQSLEDSNFWGFYPRIDWIARGSGAALGFRYWKPTVTLWMITLIFPRWTGRLQKCPSVQKGFVYDLMSI